MAKRIKLPRKTETALLTQSRRRCALCFALHRDARQKRGQIAHVDRDRANHALANLCYLCLPHHDQYDARTSQSKGYTPDELLEYRDILYSELPRLRSTFHEDDQGRTGAQTAHAMREYLYLDETRVAMYFEPMAVSGATGSRAPSKYFQLQAVVTEIRRANLVNERRPVAMNSLNSTETRRPFTEESIVARKVILPSHATKAVQGLNSLAVWIADPNPADLYTGSEQWTFRGTFLYLIEAYWDNGALQTVYSGCSALQAIANIALGSDRIFWSDTLAEPLGRDSYDHPVEKLRRMGALAGEPRRIHALYRERYLTNEQCYVHSRKEYRVNDLLAYPLYITAE